MAAQPGDKVKLEAMISMETTTSSGEFAVVVLVTAPPALGTEHSSDSSGGTRGVDLVAVLDVSAGMNEDDRLERMKQAMFSILGQFGPDDRLCILSFNDEVRRLTELEFMTDENWAVARARVGELTAPAGGANVKAATEAAATILAERGEEEQRDRVGRVIFLSNGDDEDDANAGASSEKQNNAGSSEKEQSDANAIRDLAPDAFVLGADGTLSPLSLSAGNTSAAYSYVKDTVDKIQDAPGLMSVDTALAVQVDLHAQEGVAISSLEYGGHQVPVGPDGPRSLTIYIQDLYAGEHKSFTVYLTVPEGNKEELLAVTGWYRDPKSGEDTQLDVCEVSVPRSNVGRFMAATVLWLSGMFAAIMSLLSWVWDSVPNILKKEEGAKLGKVRTVWSWARKNLYSCALVLLLLGAAVLLMPKKAEDDGKSSSLGVSQRPADWPRVEESFDFVTIRKMESAGITSCFNSALVADMCPAMNRYVYQAILHGTGFHVPLLEQMMAQMLEVEKEEQAYFDGRDGNGWHQQGEE